MVTVMDSAKGQHVMDGKCVHDTPGGELLRWSQGHWLLLGRVPGQASKGGVGEKYGAKKKHTMYRAVHAMNSGGTTLQTLTTCRGNGETAHHLVQDTGSNLKCSLRLDMPHVKAGRFSKMEDRKVSMGCGRSMQALQVPRQAVKAPHVGILFLGRSRFSE